MTTSNGYASYEVQRTDANDDDIKRAILALMARAQQDRTHLMFREEADRANLDQWRKDQARLALHLRDVLASAGTALWCLVVAAALGVGALYGVAIYRAVVR